MINTTFSSAHGLMCYPATIYCWTSWRFLRKKNLSLGWFRA